METGQLASCLLTNKSTKKILSAVLPCDLLPKARVKNILIIFNTEESWLSGRHWCSIFIDKQGNLFYFDSLAEKITNPHLINFLNLYKTIHFNKSRVQSLSSDVCGCYASVFLYYCSKGVSYRDFLNKFTDNYKENDSIIKDEFKKIFKLNYNKNQRGGQLSLTNHLINQTCRISV